VAEAKEPDAAVRGFVDGSGGGEGRRGWKRERVSCTTMGIYTSRMPQKR